MLKKILLLMVAVFALSACVTPINLVKKDAVADSHFIYVVGRVSSEFELVQNGNIKTGDQASCSILINKNPDEAPVFQNVKDRSYFDTKTKEYFVLKMPREDFYIVGIIFLLNAQEMIQIKTNIKISIKPEDSFVYIGDFVLYLENDKVFIRNEANFAACEESYSDYLKDVKKNYIAPTDRYNDYRERVKLSMWRTEITHTYQYINGRFQMTPVMNYVLDYEL